MCRLGFATILFFTTNIEMVPDHSETWTCVCLSSYFSGFVDWVICEKPKVSPNVFLKYCEWQAGI